MRLCSIAMWLGAATIVACGDDVSPAVESTGTSGTTGTSTTSGTTTSGAATDTGVVDSSSSDTGAPSGPWQPGTIYPSPTDPNPRGFLDRRGLVHAHSVYSHDACDGEPMDADGNIDPVCYEDLRRDMCTTQHDFMMLTDHREFFSGTEFPTNMLFDADRGDVLVDRADGPSANRAGCDDGHSIMVMAGCEAGTMPVGLESHVPGTGDVYGEATPEAIALLKEHGAVSLVAHTEDWTVEQLETLPLDGFEMYNLHANVLSNVAAVALLVGMVHDEDPGLPHPDLAIFPLWQEDPRYQETWGTVLFHGTRRITTMGTDSHRNSFPQILADGERIDSFRRMQIWFSNHLLVQPDADGGWDDRALKDALRAGRIYGVFEYMGYAQGFDARIEAGDAVVEIGGEASLSEAPEIVAIAPVVQELDPEVDAPTITLHVLRAVEGGFEEVAMGEDELHYVPDNEGAYRVEVRIVPRHLVPYLGTFAPDAETPRAWVYANPFYVVP
jgi:hypothetical protein